MAPNKDRHEHPTQIKQCKLSPVFRQSAANPFLLHVEIVDNDSNEEIKGKERTEDDEEDEVQVHEVTSIPLRLLTNLHISNSFFNEINICPKIAITFFFKMVMACKIEIAQILQQI